MALRRTVFVGAVFALFLAACRVSPAKSCATDADCGVGGVCNRATSSCFGPSGPSLALHIDEPPARVADAQGTTWTDSEGNAWRRNETFVLKASSTDTDVTSMSAFVSGVLKDGSHDAEVALGEMTPRDCSALGIDAAYCATVSIPLSQYALQAKRGDFRLRVEATNAEVGTSEATGDLTVTRFAWRHDAGAPLKVTPAVGVMGVYLARSHATTGNLRALTRLGEFRWNSADTLGDVKTSPAVGAPLNFPVTGAQEYVYVGGAGAFSALYWLQGSDGTRRLRCDAGGGVPYVGDFGGGVSVLQTTISATSAETAVGVVNSTPPTFVSVRSGTTCQFFSGVTAMPPGGAVATGPNSAYYGDIDGRLRGLVHASSNWALNAWGTNTGTVQVGDLGQAVSAPAVTVRNVFATVPSAGALRVNRADGGDEGRFGGPTTGTAGALALMTPATGVFAGPFPAAELAQGTFPTSGGVPATATAVLAQPTATTPLLANDGAVYTVGNEGLVQVIERDSLQEKWRLDLAETVSASPTLVCGTGGNLATLLIATQAGSLHALYIDATGLDTSAIWPKWQKDLRNSGNADASLACP